ncbi:MAG TPA: rhamnogalacturonan acetylesterase [Tepidisphaeraceae bacterium]|nr:rhamnogalacturonan acetylesterase [Tepidisphaeraceae bacterium]
MVSWRFCAASDLKFSFAPGEVPRGFVRVLPSEIYGKERGYGFEPGADVVAVDRGDGGFVTSDRPFYFSVALPEGNCNVMLTLGDPAGESTTTVKAELRRLMLQNVHSDFGKLVTRTITVNIRTPAISTGGEVHLKAPREATTEIWAWDDKLTLEFNGSRPCLDAMEITPADVPTMYILGDSTVCDQPEEPWNSWGQMITRFFKPGVAVSNQAESGETADSSLRAHRLDKVLSTMRSGDYLFIEFGHNDMKEKGPGIGAFTSYKTNLKQFVDGARAKGAIPVLLTSINRKTMDATGHIRNSLGDYPAAVRELAAEDNVPLIDLNRLTKTLYEAIGPKNLSEAFVDGTHQDAYGSYEIAKCVILGIQQDKLGLTKFIVDDWKPFDPAHPDPFDSVHIPPSPKWSKIKPRGS